MIKVFCTVVIVLGSGYRLVDTLDGYMTNERTTGNKEQIMVDFGDAMPFGPQSRWVDENDCQYYEDPVKQYSEYLKIKELNDKERIKDENKWKLVRWLRRK